MILHVIDVAGVDGRDPVEDYFQINQELRLFNEALSQLPQIVIANKIDLPDAQENIERLAAVVAKDGRQLFTISAATRQGTQELMISVWNLLKDLKAQEPEEQALEEQVIVYRPEVEHAPVEDFTIRQDDDEYFVEGAGLERLMSRLDLNNPEVVEYLQRLFQKMGLYDQLRNMNIPEGSIVHVGELEFEYYE